MLFRASTPDKVVEPHVLTSVVGFQMPDLFPLGAYQLSAKDDWLKPMSWPLNAPSDAFWLQCKGINFCISWLIIMLVQPMMLFPYSLPNAMS
jgi:hypothetical protein